MTGLDDLDRRHRAVDSEVGNVVLVVLVVAAALAVVLTIVVVAARGDRSDRGPQGAGALDALDRDVTAAGLTVCRRADAPVPQATDAVASRALVVGADCTAALPAPTSTDTGATNGTAVVQADLFADTAARDAAARTIEGLARPRASSSVRTWGDLLVVVRGGGDESVVRRLDAALTAAGAR